MLNETGKEQVELVGNRLKYEHFTRIYSSDLERAFKVIYRCMVFCIIERIFCALIYWVCPYLFPNLMIYCLQTAEGICLRNVHLKDLNICIDTSLRERVSRFTISFSC